MSKPSRNLHDIELSISKESLHKLVKNKGEKETEIKERQTELKKFKISVDKTSEERAISSGIGKILEKVLPYYKDFKIPLSDCRFLAEPLDVIVFEGASKNDVKNIKCNIKWREKKRRCENANWDFARCLITDCGCFDLHAPKKKNL